MKKYIILTSVLALAACGGGSGGGHGGGSVAPTREAVDPTAITSNGHITSMASEVLVPNGNSGAIVTRSGSVNYEGKSYTSYRLDDVNFRVATGGGSDAFLNFHMDDKGKIDSLVLDTGAGKQKMFRRNDTSADFRGVVYEYVLLEDDATGPDYINGTDKDTLVRLVYSAENDPTSYSTLQNAAAGKCPTGKKCRWDRIDQAFRISSGGNESSEDFRYSDFGKLQTTNFGKYKGVTSENFADAKTHTRDYKDGEVVIGTAKTWDNVEFDEEDFDIFGGGYKVSALQHRPTTDMHFTGKAIGSIYASDSKNHPDDSKALQDNEARLDFVGGTETLTMNFNNDESKWYKVIVTKYANNTNNITFKDFHASGNVGTKFKNETAGVVSVDNFTTTTGKAETAGDVKKEGMLDMGYYGATGPDEATGVVRYKETSVFSEGEPAKNVQYEREFRAGYGMKPTE